MKHHIKKSPLWIITIVVALALVALIIVKWRADFTQHQRDLKDTGSKTSSFIPETEPELVNSDFMIGSPKAPVQIIVYEDYANQFSAENAINLEKIRNEFDNSVMVAVRPYASKEKPQSVLAAAAVSCAGDQEKWLEMREGIFRASAQNSLNETGIKGWAEQLGLDTEKFNACLTDGEKQGIMLQQTLAAREYSVYGAPTVFVNNDLIVGARPYEDYTDSDGYLVEGLKTIVARHLK